MLRHKYGQRSLPARQNLRQVPDYYCHCILALVGGYDPQIGRFHQIDMLADKNADYSPYSFVQNNPILFLDPLRLDTFRVNGERSHKIKVRQGDVLAWTIGEALEVSLDYLAGNSKVLLEKIL